MNKRILYKRMLVSALALGVVATAVYAITQQVGTARAATETFYTICDAGTSNSRCLDLRGDVYYDNTAIVLNVLDSSQDEFRWNLAKIADVTYDSATNTGAPFTDPSVDKYYSGRPYYYLEKKTSAGHNGCIGMSTLEISLIADEIGWKSCGSTDPEPLTTEWVVSGNSYLVNVGWTNHIDVGSPGTIELMSELFNGPPGTVPPCQENRFNAVGINARGPNECNVPWSLVQTSA